MPGPEPVNEVPLTEPAEAATPGFSQTVRVDDDTDLVGIKWNGDPATEFTVEARDDDGSWTSPYPVEGMDIGPDEGTEEARQVAARRGSAYATEPVSVDDPSRIRVRVADGLATEVEFVTVGGAPAQAIGEPTGDPSPASTTTTTTTTTAPPSSPPPDTGPPPTPPGSGPARASALTWAGVALLAVSALGSLLTRRRRGRARRHPLVIIVVLTAVVAAGCFGGPSGPAKSPAPWPSIFFRASWGGPAVPACSGYTSSVRFASVHHTGGGPADNNYTDAAAKIRGIYDYHVGAGGYCDIAYNFLIDKWGTIWEGRGGGVDQPVMGAHTLNFNSESTGVALLGDFTSVNASPAAQDALVRLVAWKFTVHHVDPTAPVSKNGSWISPVSAHRELGSTSCPGNAFYPELPRLRELVAANTFYGSPVGNVEQVSRVAGGVRVIGWALDPDTSASIGIHIYVGSQGYNAGVANLSRPDIANLYPGYGDKHGFDFTVPAPPQASNVCTYAINVSHGGPALLLCRTV